VNYEQCSQLKLALCSERATTFELERERQTKTRSLILQFQESIVVTIYANLF